MWPPKRREGYRPFVTIAGDVDGDGISDFHISGHLTLVAADFVL
ncbi:MAG: hypothetical protein ACRC67_12675 [Inquilinus sp.]